MNKVVDLNTAVGKIKKADVVMLGGFGFVGCPTHTMYMLAEHKEIDELTLVSVDFGESGYGFPVGPEIMLDNGQIKKAVVSFLGVHKGVEKAVAEGRLELEFIPQGTLVERIRCAGVGLGGFYTPTGVGTEVAEGKETRIIDGREYLFEKPLYGNVALVKAYKADKLGNAVFKYTTGNTNMVMAMACDTVILEVEKLVEVGEIEPDAVQFPSCFVDYIVVCEEVMF